MPQKNKITFSDPVLQVNEEQARYILNQDPVDRIREVVQLILRVYPLDKKKPNTNRIYFDKE